ARRQPATGRGARARWQEVPRRARTDGRPRALAGRRGRGAAGYRVGSGRVNAVEMRPKHLRREPEEIVAHLNTLTQAEVASGGRHLVLRQSLPYNEAVRHMPGYPQGVFPSEAQWKRVRYADLKRTAQAYLEIGLREAVMHRWLTTFHADALEELAWLMGRSEEHTSELQSRENLVCRLLLEKKK